MGKKLYSCKLSVITIQDFGELMKESRLAPGPGNTDSAETSTQKPVERGMCWDNWLTLFLFHCMLR